MSIRIDPRESMAYQTLDENFQVVDSEHQNTKQQTPQGSTNLSVSKHSQMKSPSLEFKRSNRAPLFN